MEPITTAWLAVGLIPYHIENKRPSRRTHTVVIRALFWTLEVRARRIPVGPDRLRKRAQYAGSCDFQPPGSQAPARARRRQLTDWTLHIPLIERVRDAVWATVLRLKDGPQPPAA